MTYVGAHDSYAVGTNNVATNQDYDSECPNQANDTVRI